MNAKVMTALSFLAARSRRFRKFAPVLTVLPIALAVYRYVSDRRARQRQSLAPAPAPASSPA